MELTIYQVDAFTDRLFSGNPAAICQLQEWLPDALLLAIAHENNLSETAYLVPESDGYRLRWFTPTTEVTLCGHATLAAAHVLYNHLGYEADKVIFHTLSGTLTVKRTSDGYMMNFPTDTLRHVSAPLALIVALGITPTKVFLGREDYLVVLENRQQVADLHPDFAALRRLQGRGVIVTAPCDDSSADFVSRCFYPNAGIDEDPVTGSAHTTMAPYWAERLGKPELFARQISRRGGTLKCRLLNDRVELIGHAVTYMIGVAHID
ncbi:MAG: PhzF family phenazine biosynthesis protein [Saprospiraceae bacterium]|nr:PhzF family phenazine biosynthesis protein [Saprospiraceae bacterium]MDZ4705074.1 PhzF family phenazine biosynthesis protein [Saprospiraceae bacterium]